MTEEWRKKRMKSFRRSELGGWLSDEKRVSLALQTHITYIQIWQRPKRNVFYTIVGRSLENVVGTFLYKKNEHYITQKPRIIEVGDVFNRRAYKTLRACVRGPFFVGTKESLNAAFIRAPREILKARRSTPKNGYFSFSFVGFS